MEVLPSLGPLLVVFGLIAYLFPRATIGLLLLGTVSGSVLASLARPILKGIGLVLVVEGGSLAVLGEPVLIAYYLHGHDPFGIDVLATELIDGARSIARELAKGV